MLKYFRLPFATTGDKTAVPDAVDSNGNVSYSQGYGFDYQRQKTDPAAKNIERDKMNQIFFDMTTAIAELQSQGVPDFITTALNGGTAYSYAQYAVVKYSGDLYISLVAANTALPSDATKWALLPTPARIQAAFNSSAVAAGTADAILGTFTPAIAALPAAPGTLSLFVRATAANTTTTPTFKADGTTAKTIVKGNNLPLVAGDIAGAGHWLELQYDATLDKWILQNPAMGAAATAPQFDNTTKVATTEFVKRQGIQAATVYGYNTTQTLPVSVIGAHVSIGAGIAGQVFTLPSLASIPPGSVVELFCYGLEVTISAAAGQTINQFSANNQTMVMKNGTNLRLVAESATVWNVQSGTAQLPTSPLFGASLIGSGYQKLPSGLILQWGLVTTNASGLATFTFPITFPTATIRVLLTASGTNTVATVGATTTSSVNVNCFTGNTGAGKAENVQVFAIGN